MSKGANLDEVDKEGITPLTMACIRGRADSVRFIYDQLKKTSGDDVDETMVRKFGIAGIGETCLLTLSMDLKSKILAFQTVLKRTLGVRFTMLLPMATWTLSKSWSISTSKWTSS